MPVARSVPSTVPVAPSETSFSSIACRTVSHSGRWRRMLVCCGLAWGLGIAQAAPPSSAEVNRYINDLAPALLGAQVDAITDFLPESQRAQMRKGFEAEAKRPEFKKSLSVLVQTYLSAEDLRAVGGSEKTVSEKRLAFLKEQWKLMNKSMMEVSRRVTTASGAGDWDEAEPGGSEAAAAKREALVLREVTERVVEGKVFLTGILENTGEKTVRGVQLEANFFQGEAFVDQYSAYVSGSVPAKGKRYFKISCGCKDSPPAPHDRFEVLIQGPY